MSASYSSIDAINFDRSEKINSTPSTFIKTKSARSTGRVYSQKNGQTFSKPLMENVVGIFSSLLGQGVRNTVAVIDIVGLQIRLISIGLRDGASVPQTVFTSFYNLPVAIYESIGALKAIVVRQVDGKIDAALSLIAKTGEMLDMTSKATAFIGAVSNITMPVIFNTLGTVGWGVGAVVSILMGSRGWYQSHHFKVFFKGVMKKQIRLTESKKDNNLFYRASIEKALTENRGLADIITGTDLSHSYSELYAPEHKKFKRIMHLVKVMSENDKYQVKKYFATSVKPLLARMDQVWEVATKQAQTRPLVRGKLNYRRLDASVKKEMKDIVKALKTRINNKKTLSQMSIIGGVISIATLILLSVSVPGFAPIGAVVGTLAVITAAVKLYYSIKAKRHFDQLMQMNKVNEALKKEEPKQLTKHQKIYEKLKEEKELYKSKLKGTLNNEQSSFDIFWYTKKLKKVNRKLKRLKKINGDEMYSGGIEVQAGG